MARLLRLFFILLGRSLRTRRQLLLENLALRQQILVLALISSGRFQASAFITGHAHLYELNRVFEKLMNRSTESEIKTAIVP
jgi:threonine dehydrogenase-like Zn-dependent dehydrogenase